MPLPVVYGTVDRRVPCPQRLFRQIGFVVALCVMGTAEAALRAADDPTALANTEASATQLKFNRDVRPLLSDHCFACHGPDAHARQAELRLDDAAAAQSAGAILPGDPTGSTLLARITAEDPAERMPPAETGKQLTAEQIETLKTWIAQGAQYEPHWAFVEVPQQVPLPANSAAEAWALQPLDYFVYTELQRRGLAPAAAAEKSVWLRRAAFDLTGLPPPVAELDAFLADSDPQSYERAVDRLLASPAFGERMASLWLDVARYADTFGYQSDVEMDVWPWRDWVIQAFNQNLPYDQFLTWQIAGDQLEPANRAAQLATAFNRLHRQTNEGGSIEEEFRHVYIADRTTTVGTAFLGLTFECARCHDHKYDPLPQRDFYQLAAYFCDIDEHGLYSHFTRTAPTPAMLLYQNDAEEQAHQGALAQIATLEREVEEVREAAVARSHSAEQAGKWLPATLPKPDFSFPLDGGEPGVVGSSKRFNGDDAETCSGVPQLGRHTPLSFSVWVKPAVQTPRMIVLHQSVAAEDSAFRGLQLTLDNGAPEFSLIHFWPGNALRVQSTHTLPLNDTWSQVGVTYDGSGKASGVRIYVGGKFTESVVERDQLTRDIIHRAEWGDSNAGSVELALGARFRDIGFRDGGLDQLQIYLRQLSDAEMYRVIEADQQPGQDARSALTEEERLQHYLLTQDAPYQAKAQALLAARVAENELSARVRQIMTMKPAVQHRSMQILRRGAYDQPGETVEPSPPACLPGRTQYPPTRLGLAEWMTARDNPLVSRVAVNRFWQLFFGRGLINTLGDFGSQGEPPSHPELLDWLAADFMDNGWDVKALCRRVVLSSTYRQSSTPRVVETLTADPDNRWLARGPRHRLSAEQVRDLALAASGLLVPTVGGPSVYPYQPAGLWEEAGTGKSYQQSHGADLYRRSLYTFWRRTSPPPTMLTFDATSRETCTAKRELTSTPLQSLVLLNDPQFVEAARALAQTLLQQFPNLPDQRWEPASLRLMSRPLRPAELSVLKALYAEQHAYFAAQPTECQAFLQVGESPRPDTCDPTDLAATTVVIQAILGNDETITKR